MKKLFFALSVLFFFSPALAKSYTIQDALIRAKIDTNGALLVNETVTYVFDGCFQTVYRAIPLGGYETIHDIRGYSDRGFSPNQWEERKIYNYEFNFNQKVCNDDVTITLSYYFKNALKVYEDAAEIHYQFWGSGWQSIKSVEFELELPNEATEFWVHPFYGIDRTEEKEGDIIKINSQNLPDSQWSEIRVLFPKEGIDPVMALDLDGEITDIIRKDEESFRINNLLYYIFSFITPVFILIPIAVFSYFYSLHGKEPKIDYFAPYEREPPYDEPPALVKAKLEVDRSIMPDIRAWTATVFDLVRKGHLSLSDIKKIGQGIFGKKEVHDTIIKIHKKDTSKLEDFELTVLNFLKEKSKCCGGNKGLSWNELESHLADMDNALDFRKLFEAWKSKVRLKVSKKELYDEKGRKIYFMIAGILLALNSLLIFFVVPALPNSYTYPAIGARMKLGLWAVEIIFLISLMLPSIILGRRTKEGALYYHKWKNFEKFLNDFSMIKQYPPESVKIWEQFLVYAVMFGTAETVLKAMKLRVPEQETHFGAVYMNYYMISSMNSSFMRGSMASRSPSGAGAFGGVGGGGGGFGGGVGGGGGGAR